ncbi:hypothetical protein IAI10_19310 [Clostridium sp. 19966]|uniref:hypothetical protein n=1 Tax=Clostridium sp. 19966 TaxID=2768166 RepID=UPI0028E07FAA|nr:hypothetical protein [Clostridium sp. 19966]MDT8718808.1 hypothetical protein [Clostridium sp. 19966]
MIVMEKRKYKRNDNVYQPFIYIDKGDAVEYQGNKPITVKVQRHNQLPVNIYTEFKCYSFWLYLNCP